MLSTFIPHVCFFKTLKLIQFKLPLRHIEDNSFHRTLTKHLLNTLLIIKRQVTQTLPQQLHLAISAQFYTQFRTCRGIKQTQ